MKVEVICFGALREYLPDDATKNRSYVELDDGATAGELIDAMGAPRRLVFSLLIDGTRAEHGEQLHDGAEVTLMPAFSGGSLG